MLRREASKICESAGTGRQARLRGVCQPTWEFKSPLSHQRRRKPCKACGGFFIPCIRDSPLLSPAQCIEAEKHFVYGGFQVKKRVFYSEIAYVLGIVLVALGVMLSEKANFGLSMVVAPAYLLYRWINPMWSVFSFGMAEYFFQAVLIILMAFILRRFRICYLLSFATAVIYGLVLDGLMALGAFLPASALWQRAIYYILGVVICSAGVSMMFHTYLSPEAYELFVKEVSEHFGVNINKFKTAYDCASCVIGLVMSFLIFGIGKFVGINWGTVLCALVNGLIIGRFSVLYEKLWDFRDALPWRSFFTGEKRESSAAGNAG